MTNPHKGHQAPRRTRKRKPVYDPTPEEIEAMKAAIRADWDAVTEVSRNQYKVVPLVWGKTVCPVSPVR